MEIAYYDLSGGINQASTKTELGLNTKKIYWSDSCNVEILRNNGICKQKGNTLKLTLPDSESIVGMHEIKSDDMYKLVFITESGKIYVRDDLNNTLSLVDKTLTGIKPMFADFLSGIIIATESDSPFYLDFDLTVSPCNLLDEESNPIIVSSIAIYKSRVWFSSGSTIYYSALGTYDDFTTPDDAGFICDFHADTSNIVAMKQYKNYIAVYKFNTVYLLSGTTPNDFAITLFADKGCFARESIVNVDNKQYFLSNGIYALEQVGDLAQIQLGSEISRNIQKEILSFSSFDLRDTICLHYENKHQIWYFFPYPSENYFHTIWINDYLNKAWYKRQVPQNITTCCKYKNQILTADNLGKIYIEDYGTTFDGTPINFMWKSPFLSLNSPHHRKLIDEFYFILDQEYDNDFRFSVYKDYDSEYQNDVEQIYSVHLEHLIWADDNTHDNLPCHWALDDENVPIWSISTETLEKAEISDSNYSIQLCVEGEEISHSCAIIGLQFREIYNDD